LSFCRDDEKAVFERFIDFVIARLKVYPDLHIYHFAPYEPAHPPETYQAGTNSTLKGTLVLRADSYERPWLRFNVGHLARASADRWDDVLPGAVGQSGFGLAGNSLRWAVAEAPRPHNHANQELRRLRGLRPNRI
jgi:hypothetical protein